MNKGEEILKDLITRFPDNKRATGLYNKLLEIKAAKQRTKQ